MGHINFTPAREYESWAEFHKSRAEADGMTVFELWILDFVEGFRHSGQSVRALSNMKTVGRHSDGHGYVGILKYSDFFMAIAEDAYRDNEAFDLHRDTPAGAAQQTARRL